ncbi:ABC transporter substrate-binding protein [Streptomyces oceani]|uniref:ABC transporter substrate-binding protein n=1 Tax=Streptomyces oceani TaxID=1075402 RepID=A0A1E7JZJ8_9ACTN|nr:sugar ABC transporter substrate-binding protein [Streptomyces oceani]OEU97035.1 hypothetical protein AN216_17410 [Streptomyces oceani]
MRWPAHPRWLAAVRWRRRCRTAATALLALTLTAALASCAGGDDRDGSTLRVWLVEANIPQVAEGYDALVADFERRHPDVDVELTQVPYQQYRDKLVLAVQGGAGPDVMALDQIWSPEFAAAKLIEPLDRRTQRAGVREKDYFPAAWASNRWQGRIYGLPFNVGAWQRMFYNADLFREAGLDPDEPPRTWREWKRAAERIDKLPAHSGISLIGCRDEASSVLTDSFLYSAGGHLTRDGRADFDTPANRRAYGFFQRLAEHTPNGVAGACAEDTMAHFTAGETGMLLDGGWQSGSIGEQVSFDWRVTTPPSPTGRDFTGAMGGYNLAVGSEAPDKRLAFSFARLATASVPHQLATNDSVPALRKAGERFVREHRERPEQVLRLLETAEPRPVSPVYVRISRAQQGALQSILSGEDIGGALAEAERSMQQAIDRP